MVKITDHTGEKFGFFKKKKDGSLTASATQFKDMGLDEGSTVRIGYVIETYEDKSGITRESHKTLNFQETNDSSTQGSQTPEKPRGEAPTHSQVASSRDFDKENIGKCQSLFLQAYIQAGHSFSDTLLQVAQAKKLAELVVYGYSESVSPDIQEAAEQMVSEAEDVPFADDELPNY